MSNYKRNSNHYRKIFNSLTPTMGTRAVMEYHSTLRTMRAFNKTVNIKDFGVALEKSSENIQKIIEVIHFDKMSRPGTKYELVIMFNIPSLVQCCQISQLKLA